MNAMTCNDVEEQIELFAAGECDPPIASAIRRHMTGCARCTKAEIEARQFLDMMDLRLQEPDRLQRLLDRIAEDQRAAQWNKFPTCPDKLETYPTDGPAIWPDKLETYPTVRPVMPSRRVSRSSRQRWFAIAASILLPIGVGVWLTPPADSPSPEQARTQLSVALLPDRSSRGHEKLMVPAPAIDKASSEKVLTFQLQADGQSSKTFRSKLIEAASKGQHAEPPEVDLMLEIRNSTNHPIRLRFDDPRAELRFALSGPGVLRIDAPINTDPFAGLRILDIASGSSRALPIRRLIGGSRSQPVYWYWTEPGNYRLRPVLRVPIESDGKTTLTAIGGPTVWIQVK
jgi:hypothetical protein